MARILGPCLSAWLSPFLFLSHVFPDDSAGFSFATENSKLDDGWPESVEEYSERYKYEDLIYSMKQKFTNIR